MCLVREVLTNVKSHKTNKLKRHGLTKHPQHNGKPREFFQNRGQCFRKQCFDSGKQHPNMSGAIHLICLALFGWPVSGASVEAQKTSPVCYLCNHDNCPTIESVYDHLTDLTLWSRDCPSIVSTDQTGGAGVLAGPPDPNVPTLTPDGTGELSKEAKIAIGVPATIALLVILVIIIIVALRRRTRSRFCLVSTSEVQSGTPDPVKVIKDQCSYCVSQGKEEEMDLQGGC
ncbi:uncharacterized protein LOC115186691 isoform X5 [Salmo trutta]|uniref:uncharacterized protein LOC115186691 isoform X5 n=1 Tax=Salmo trutta TaxID=8032 RepID=UPI001131579C|nr:uncharacterized protein LOC115186691 isoform X5 [Salmo trutta]